MHNVLLQQMAESNPLTAVTIGFSSTLFAYNITTKILKTLPTKKSPERLEQLAIDFAMTPVRLLLIPLCLPSLIRSLDKDYIWQPIDSNLLTVAWIILSTGYVFDMANTKPSVMGCVHHAIAVSFTYLVNRCFRTGSPLDGPWLIFLSSNMVFAVGVGGVITSCLRVLYLLHPPTKQPQRPELAFIASFLTWALTFTIMIAWCGPIGSYLRDPEQMYAITRYWTPLLSLGGSLIFVVQWWWIFLWHNKKEAMFKGDTTDRKEIFRRCYFNLASFICAFLVLGFFSINFLCARSISREFIYQQ